MFDAFDALGVPDFRLVFDCHLRACLVPKKITTGTKKTQHLANVWRGE